MKDYIDLFNESYTRVVQFKNQDKDFFTRFYEIFIPTSEEISEKFTHTNMEAQRNMLRESLFHMLDFYTTKQVSDYLYKIALKHGKAAKDIPIRLYDVWLESLLKAVREYDEQFNDDIELAWHIALAPGIAYMKFHYEK